MTSMNLDRTQVGWSAFALKMGLGALWLGAIAAGGWMLRAEGLVPRVAGGLLVGLPAVVWMLSLRRRARVDELEAKLAVIALAEGGWWAVSFGALYYALTAARGEPASGFLLAMLPLGAFFFGEALVQAERVNLAGRGRR